MPKKETKNYGDTLDANKMRVTPDKNWIIVGNQRFKLEVLPSSAAPKQTEADRLLDELDEES